MANSPETAPSNGPLIDRSTECVSKNHGRYSQAALQVFKILSRLSLSLPLNEHESLEEKFRHMETDIEYDQYTEEFASKFWLRNYWKAAYACEFLLNHKKTTSICSMGAGSGSDAVALLAAVDIPNSPLLHLTLVDRSLRQLQLAKHIFSIIKPTSNDFLFEIEYEHMEIQTMSSSQQFDLIMLSHVLTENPDSLSQILTNALGILSDTGSICIIERERDPIWQSALNFLKYQSGLIVHHESLDQPKLLELLTPLGDQQRAFTDMTPHYVVAKKTP